MASQRLPGRDEIPASTLAFGVHLEDVLLHRLGQGVLALDALQTRRQHDGEGQVGVAGGIGRAELDAGGLLLAGLVHGHADQGRAVAAGPGDVDRRLVAGHQPLVGVHPLVGDQARSRGRASDARRCSSWPCSDRWYLSLASKKAFLLPLNRDWWTCMPLPFWPKMGLGMKVA